MTAAVGWLKAQREGKATRPARVSGSMTKLVVGESYWWGFERDIQRLMIHVSIDNPCNPI